MEIHTLLDIHDIFWANSRENDSAKNRVHFNIINTMRPRLNGQRFADDIFKRIFVKENVLYFYGDFTEICS